MSITVNPFDVYAAEEELKNCPKIVRQYVKMLKRSNEEWKHLTNKAIEKLKDNGPTT